MSMTTVVALAVVTWALLGALAALDLRVSRRECWGLWPAIGVGAVVGAVLGLLVIWAIASVVLGPRGNT